VTVAKENIANLMIVVAQELNPELDDVQLSEMRQNIIQDVDTDGLIGDLKIHSRAPGLWSVVATGE